MKSATKHKIKIVSYIAIASLFCFSSGYVSGVSRQNLICEREREKASLVVDKETDAIANKIMGIKLDEKAPPALPIPQHKPKVKK